jgi:SAM-dependent methyltransferase
VSAKFGFDRGLPIDRWYIERWLGTVGGDIRGRVLEVKEDLYTTRFGGRLEQVDVVDVDPANSHATITADLTEPGAIREGGFDCIVCTQTLQFVRDFRAALATLHAALRQGGVLLATVPGIAPLAGDEAGEYWRFTAQSARLEVESVFGAGAVDVTAYGNVVSAASFLYGLAAEELDEADLVATDPRFEVILAIRACRS